MDQLRFILFRNNIGYLEFKQHYAVDQDIRAEGTNDFAAELYRNECLFRNPQAGLPQRQRHGTLVYAFKKSFA